MYRDIRSVLRGNCLTCTCPCFISLSGIIRCDYCGCPPAQHQAVHDQAYHMQQVQRQLEHDFQRLLHLKRSSVSSQEDADSPSPASGDCHNSFDFPDPLNHDLCPW